MRIATSEIMKNIDRYCIENLKIPGIILMENAALKVVKNIDMNKYNSFTVVCGRGNNGGDGFAIARNLYVSGKSVEVHLIGSSEGMSEDCRINYTILKNMGLKINKVNNIEDAIELRDSLNRNEVTIDAIFGTGLDRKLEGIYDQVISIINENSSYIISVDVPSGFEDNMGIVLGNCVKADKTISFSLYKRGFLNYDTDKYTGKIIMEDIGIPSFVIDKFHENEFIMDKEMIRARLIKRGKYAHKGDYGRTLIIAGSKGFTGAAYISTEGAVRSGAGLVTLCCNEDIVDILSSKLKEAMTISSDDEVRLNSEIDRSDVIAIGPGMGNNENTLNMLQNLIRRAKCPVIIDADGINVLKDNLHILKEKQSEVIITPHFGEMARITGLSINQVQQNRMEIAKEFAREHGVIVLLKGYNTIITDGITTIINPTGNSSMASGGMGDCLTGMITAFIGQGYKPIEAACIATFIHGYCGEVLSKQMFCVNASHVIEKIPFAIKDIQENN